MTATSTRGPTGFGVLDRPRAWPSPRSAPRPERLELPLDTLPGVGPSVRKRLAKLELETVGDLLAHRPRRYVEAQRIADLFGEDETVIEGVVAGASSRRARGRMTVQKARVGDQSGAIECVWFNQPWVAERLRPGTRVRLIGSLRRGSFAVRSHDVLDEASPPGLTPVYPASEDVASGLLRRLAEAALVHARDLPEPLPAELREREGLPLRADALHALHRPRSLEEADAGRRRLAFDELLALQVGLARIARARETAVAPELGAAGELIARYRRALPFALTPYQEKAVREIDADLARPVPMQRLLQGDVGSGKTVVALYALLRAVEAGRQGALMAPTETLAEQHFLTVEPICRELGVTCALLTSSVPARERRTAPEASILVGTHALIQEGVELPNLAVAVVDEQHRFGVAQRQALAGRSRNAGEAGPRAKPASLSTGAASGASGVEQRAALTEGRTPHVLHMTATPIPRTLALTVYGDLQVSEIAKPPADRKPVVTRWIREERASVAYTRLTRLLREERQAYVVCPLIEQSETSRARAAEAEADRLRAHELRGFRVGCLHGKLRPADRRELMARFKARDLDVLVATTVIEVGVDVPNATVMIVQEADRFGLAQLHQLRGRVGRGAEQSFCLLVSRPKEELTEDARRRLEALEATTDGFELAEVDLDIRGEGQLLGTRQHGRLSGFRFVRLRADRPLLERARALAPGLAEPGGPLDDEVERLFGGADPAA